MILGIDFSLTSTGVCAITDGEAECITIRSSKEETWDAFPRRVESIAVAIHEWAGDEMLGAALVIETPAFAGKSSSLDRMFGGWWIAVNTFSRLGYDTPLRVTPQQVKKYATGKGNANKDEVLAAVIRRYPDVFVTGNDQADALVLAAIGAGVYGEPFETGTKYQQEVVEAVRLRGEVE